jgi:hypothetical protein
VGAFALNRYQWIDDAILDSLNYLFDEGGEVDPGHWQGVSTEGHPDLVTQEVMNLQWSAKMPESREEAAALIMPNIPWAENHFQERVGGEPSNPGQWYKTWPWWNDQDEYTMLDGKFTHTYQERFWPPTNVWGIRYHYGNLNDVVSLLAENPHTRQATFPIFFPEDTGSKHGGRVPCTLHYHFLMRDNLLHLWYAIRSCDAVRHFRDDIYMAVRLAQWVNDKLYYLGDGWQGVEVGDLHFTAYSFHVHKGDIHRYQDREAPRLHADRGQDR